MSVIDAGTLSELLEAFPKAIVEVSGDRDIVVEFEVSPNGAPVFNVKKKDRRVGTQSGQHQKA